MAEYRPNVPPKVKQALLKESGGKCANPGCPNVLTEIHHIKEWCVYKTHDQDHMIAICPSCHDAVTRGGLRIDDATLYRWKNIRRTPKAMSAYVYLEPGDEPPKLVLGSLCVQGATSFTVFELNKYNDLEFCLRGDAILLPRLRMGHDTSVLIDVVEGHVIQRHPDVAFQYRPGKVNVVYARLAEHIPDWAHPIINSDTGLNLREQPLLDLEALSPGILRVKGVWVRRDFVVIINDTQLSFVYPGLQRPLSLKGAGTNTVLIVSGPSILFEVSNQALPRT
ncbi:MAG TPA: HNH endonuclease signature motif containing protein [Ktedonobacterales bacterium]|nr:HNH endonuclease signature motif containing protein [Ktedonobacterales bacterium]